MKYCSKANLYVLLLLLVCSRGSVVFAQTFQTTIDSMIMATISDQQGPGGVFLVAKNGKKVYHKAIGKANLELNVNLTTDHVFQLGSMTKQFTAVAILMLEEQGKLRVDQPVSAFIPDYPSGNAITLHHLLTHTSGIKDFTKMKALGDIAQKEMTPKMMVDFFKNEPIDFKPGEKFEYNNSGYVLLGYIVELVSGESYKDYVEKHIFHKLGMEHSFYATDRLLIRNRAYGYQKKELGFVNRTVISFSVPFSSGALMSTSDDMLKWQRALTQHVLLSKESTEKAFNTYKLNSGQDFSYGYGWHVKEIDGIKDLEHGGSIFGFKTMGVYIPEVDIYVLGLTNCDCNSPTQLVKNIAAKALQWDKSSGLKSLGDQ